VAGKVSYLYERDDFPQLIETTAQSHGIADPAIVEKDYYVTEALRIIAQGFGDVVLFKGGTSLSKGWNLIRRFSEDIDLYVAPADSEQATATRFQAIAEAIAAFPGFTGRSGRKDTGSSSWVEEFSYKAEGAAGTVRPVVLLEAGIQSADQPTEERTLRSLLGETLDARGVKAETDDRAGFTMPLLHFRRTFVEKLFTLHGWVERCIHKDRDLGRNSRHYYDLNMLIQEQAVQEMLASAEYALICRQYRQLTAMYFPGQLKLLPDGMNLHESSALFPDAKLQLRLKAAYKSECDTLCFDDYPSFEAVLDAFQSVRDKLSVNLEDTTE
jgi:hypothetical protein